MHQKVLTKFVINEHFTVKICCVVGDWVSSIESRSTGLTSISVMCTNGPEWGYIHQMIK